MRGRDVGLIAQEVLSVLPEAVCPAPFDQTYMTVVQGNRIVALLIEAVKELAAAVDEINNNVRT
jgi:hypothetical protein